MLVKNQRFLTLGFRLWTCGNRYIDDVITFTRFVGRDRAIESMDEFRIDSSGDGFDQVSIINPKYLLVRSPNMALEGKSSLYSCFSGVFMLEYILGLCFWWFLMDFEANLIKFLHLTV